ncbi:MAG: major facilitator superfamily protein [Anaerolineaceae bacterium]|nr:MAG: major facilitator superfamily protein [Anaerolineaceae bacterium]
MHIPPALHNRRYVALWLGLLISISGSQMQVAAIHWHIRTLTGEPNPLALGGIGLARILPIIVFSFIGGPLADTFNRRRILFVTQTVMALTALALAALTYTGGITIWWIYALTALQAAAVAFDGPARQAMIPNIVAAEDLPSAFSMSSIAMNAGSIVGPALAGIVIATLGQGYTYLFNAISFLAVIIALFVIGRVPQDAHKAPGVNLKAAADGVRFIFSKPIILSTMLMDFVATFFASANTMMPIVAKDILKVGEIGYGWLSSAQAVGSVAAGLVVSQIPKLRRQGPKFLGAVVVFGLATILFGTSHLFGVDRTLLNLTGSPITVAFLVAFAALVLMGAADAVSTIIRNTIRQLNTPDHIRGRMTAVNQIFFQGGPQLGEVEAGIVASLFGVPFAIVSGGIGCIVGMALIVLKWPELRHYNGDEHQAGSGAAG